MTIRRTSTELPSKSPDDCRAGACGGSRDEPVTQEHQIPESFWSWDDEVRVGRVTVASGHLHRAGAVPMDSCRKWQQNKLIRAGNGKLPRQASV